MWKRIERDGREYVEQEYDVMVQVGKLERIYDELI